MVQYYCQYTLPVLLDHTLPVLLNHILPVLLDHILPVTTGLLARTLGRWPEWPARRVIHINALDADQGTSQRFDSGDTPPLKRVFRTWNTLLKEASDYQTLYKWQTFPVLFDTSSRAVGSTRASPKQISSAAKGTAVIHSGTSSATKNSYSVVVR